MSPMNQSELLTGSKQDKKTLNLLQVIQVDLCIVSRDKTLNLRRGEHVQPLWVNDAAEAPNESWCLLLDLRVHAEVSHQVDVADPARNKTVISYAIRVTIYHNLKGAESFCFFHTYLFSFVTGIVFPPGINSWQTSCKDTNKEASPDGFHIFQLLFYHLLHHILIPVPWHPHHRTTSVPDLLHRHHSAIQTQRRGTG